MLSIAMFVGFGVTGVMLYMFTTEALKQYAVLKAMGATSKLLLTMVFVQSAVCARYWARGLASGCAPSSARSPLWSSTIRSA